MALHTANQKPADQDPPRSASQTATESESSSLNGSTPLTTNTTNASLSLLPEGKTSIVEPMAISADAQRPAGKPTKNLSVMDKKAKKSPEEKNDDDEADDYKDDDEDVSNLSDSIEFPQKSPDPLRTDFMRDDLQRAPKTLEERITKAPKQVKQIVQYTKLMEDRVQALEAQVQALSSADDSLAETKDLAEVQKATSTATKLKTPLVPLETVKLIAEVHRSGEADYRRGHGGADEKHYIMDVWVSDINEVTPQLTTTSSDPQTQSLTAENVHRERRPSVANAIAPERGAIETPVPRPKRLRINSKRLLLELLNVTEQVKETDLKQFLAPFQLFTIYERQIRDHLDYLEKYCRGEIDKPQETVAESTKEPDSAKIAESTKDNADQPTDTIAAKDRSQPVVPDPAQAPTPIIKGSNDQYDPANQKSDKTIEVDRGVVEEDDQEEVEEVDEDGDRLSLRDLLEIVETCQVSRKRAAKMLKEHRNVSSTIEEISTKMSPEEKRLSKIGEKRILLEEWRALIAFLDVDLKSTLDMCAQIREGKLKAIAYDDLSHLFKPGDIVISLQNRRFQAYVLIATSGGRQLLVDKATTESFEEFAPEPPMHATSDTFFHSPGRYSPFVVDCFYYDFDGIGFECVSKRINIPKYDDMKSVTSLAVYPDAMRDDPSRNLIAELTARGQRFVELCSEADTGHRQYLGRTMDETPEEVDSQVIIDCQTAATVQRDDRPDEAEWMPAVGLETPTEPDEREIMEAYGATGTKCSQPDCRICSRIERCFFNDQKFNRQKSKEYVSSWEYLDREIEGKELRDDELALLPSRVFGFILRSRKWARLDIDKISTVTNEGNGFKKLVLKKGYAEIVQALVETHFNGPSPGTEKVKQEHEVDLVRGKGKGLIILLHGAPGVGKTSTAESVAEFVKRPLFPITCGDIGETANEVEHNLDRCFKLAHKWGCVLLLDEADVFLAKRDKGDLKRNAMVSVFLRVLEYYAGILFLTTNRVGTFDDAFKSRIHMSLYYPELNHESTLQVWEMNLERTRENMKDLEVESFNIIRFAEKHYKKARIDGHGRWNGRQIRNAFQTAIALAQWDARQELEKTGVPKKARLTAERFIQVAEASLDFDRYLAGAHGLDENERAGQVKERAPEWETPKSRPKARTPGSKPNRSHRSDPYDEEKVKNPRSRGPYDSEENNERTYDSEDE